MQQLPTPTPYAWPYTTATAATTRRREGPEGGQGQAYTACHLAGLDQGARGRCMGMEGLAALGPVSEAGTSLAGWWRLAGGTSWEGIG